MITTLGRFLPFGHKECKKEIHRLIQNGLDDNQKIKSLNYQLTGFIDQIQELKAINDHQTFQLEQKIIELEKELASFSWCKGKKTVSKAIDGDIVTVVDNRKDKKR